MAALVDIVPVLRGSHAIYTVVSMHIHVDIEFGGAAFKHSSRSSNAALHQNCVCVPKKASTRALGPTMADVEAEADEGFDDYTLATPWERCAEMQRLFTRACVN